jgi:ferredoxin
MREPQAAETEPLTLARDRRRLALLLAALPLLILAGGLLGAKFSPVAATLNPTVSLAERLVREQNAPLKTGVLAPDDLALDRARQHSEDLLAQAGIIRHKFKIGTWIFGAWIGAVVGLKLIGLSLQRKRIDYEPSAAECVACARCFEFCPNELTRRGVPVLASTAGPRVENSLCEQAKAPASPAGGYPLALSKGSR